MLALSKYTWFRKLIIIFLFLILVSTGCLQSTTQNPPLSPFPTAVIITNTPKKPTNTALPSLTPTWTPIPKLSREDALVRFWTLYENTSGCELPCWWNITPGETSWGEVNNQLNPLGRIILTNTAQDLKSYVFLFDLPPEVDSLSGQLSVGFIVEEDKVQAIGVGSQWVGRNFDYSLAGLLKHLGQPTEIWLQLFPEYLDGIPHYDMQMFFLNKGVWIWMNGNATIENEIMTICPQDSIENPSPRSLFIWNLEKAKSANDVQNTFELFWGDGWKLKHYKLLEDLQSNIDTKEFYKVYIDPNATKCFNVNAQSTYIP